MMRKVKSIILLAAVAMVALAACSSRGAVASDNKVEETAAVSDTASLENRVQEIYGAVFKVYNEEDSLRNLDIMMADGVYQRRGDFVANYCSREWNELVNKIDEIDSLYHADDMGFWDFDYWIMGQDWHKLSISDVKVVEMNATEAAVELKLHNFDKITPLYLSMKQEDGTWRIDDFVDLETGAGLKEYMKEYIANETAETKKK